MTWSVSGPQAVALSQQAGSLSGVRIAVPGVLPRDVVRALVRRGAAVGLLLEAGDPLPDMSALSAASFTILRPPGRGSATERLFAVRGTATQLRAAGATTIVLDAAPADLRAWSAEIVASYVDAWIAPEGRTVGSMLARPMWRARDHIDPQDVVAVVALGTDGTPVLVRDTVGDLRSDWLRTLADWLPEGLSALHDVHVACEPACTADTWLHPTTLDAITLVAPSAPVRDLRITPGLLAASILDATGLETTRPVSPGFGGLVPGGGRTSPFLLRITGWRGGVEPVFTTGTEARASPALTAAEIVARHQAARAAQDRIVASVIAHGRLVLTFDVPGFFTPVSITAKTTSYQSGGPEDVVLEEILVDGAPLAAGNDRTPPRLPLVDAARIAVPPLLLVLNDAYDYRREADAVVARRPMYVVSFRSRAETGDRAHGRAWIDAEDFHLAQLEVIRSGLAGPITSVEQKDRLGAVRIGGRTAWLPVESRMAQAYEGAGHRTTIQRVQTIDRYDINAPDFAARHTAALASPAVIVRATPDGFRYLLREGASPRGRGARSVAAATAGRRIRALIGGVVVDPDISAPLPFAGLNFTDLNLFGRGVQLNAFFGGTVGQVAWQGPAVGATQWRFGGDATGIAVRYNDRRFRNGREIYAENVRQRPFHAAFTASRPLTGRTRLRLQYALDVTAYARGDTTAPTFVVPPTAWVHGATIGLDAQHGRWTLRGWWNPAWRRHWAAWGPVDHPEPATSAFQRAGVHLGRAVTVSPRLTAHVEVEGVAGWRLDRFSRYTIGTLERVLHGYPAASLRYDRGVTGRAVVSWMTVRGLRINGFADLGVLRDPGFGPSWRGYPGVGAAAESVGPFRTLWSIDWGYGVRAVRSSGGLGAQVVRISVYRVF